MDRRTSLQWMLAAATSLPLSTLAKTAGVGTDPSLVKTYRPGDLWPLRFDAAQRRTAGALCGVIIPADEGSPSAEALQVHVFIDEWISAPYPDHAKDRALIVDGLAWLDRESTRRHGRAFADADAAQQAAICDDICYLPQAAPRLRRAARFFARFRDLTAGGFYTSPEGAVDLRFAGNKPSAQFDGPPPEVLRIVGVS